MKLFSRAVAVRDAATPLRELTRVPYGTTQCYLPPAECPCHSFEKF